MRLALALAALTLGGCAAAPRSRAAGALLPLSVRPVAWNPAQAAVGHVRAVAEAGQVVAVFGDKGATVLASGAVVATDTATTDWVGADTLRGADGTPSWIVGLDRRGRLHHLRGTSTFEDVTARYGLGGRSVLGATLFDPLHAGFLLEGEVIVADGSHAQRFAYGGATPWVSFAGGGGWGAGVSRDTVTLFQAAADASMLEPRTFALAGVTRAALGKDGRLYAATKRAVYAASAGGDLSLLYDAEGDTIHGLVVSGDNVWFADGAELGAVDGDRVSETTGIVIPTDATLAPSPSGDVWVVGGGTNGGLQRLARAEGAPSVASTFRSVIGAIFARDCASCHLPGGVSGTDLSTRVAWENERAVIRERVVVERSMPPEGHAIPEGDRAAIRAWVESALPASP